MREGLSRIKSFFGRPERHFSASRQDLNFGNEINKSRWRGKECSAWQPSWEAFVNFPFCRWKISVVQKGLFSLGILMNIFQPAPVQSLPAGSVHLGPSSRTDSWISFLCLLGVLNMPKTMPCSFPQRSVLLQTCLPWRDLH